MRPLTGQKGFTLVEIMIVVAIIGILAAMAIPNLLRTRLNTNDNAIKIELRTFSSGNENYRSAQNPPSYAPDVATLSGGTPAYVDNTWNAMAKHGFNLAYTVAAAPAGSYSLIAVPTLSGQTAINTYCVDQNGVIFGSTNEGTANVPTAAATGCTGGVPI